MAMRWLLFAGLLLTGGMPQASATIAPPRALPELVAEAEQIVVARVVAVEMVDGSGRMLTDPQAPTGPGLDNQLQLVLQVSEVLRPAGGRVPASLRVPLWKMWHDSLGAARTRELGHEAIFLLKRDRHRPVDPADFQRPLQERDRIRTLMASPS